MKTCPNIQFLGSFDIGLSLGVIHTSCTGTTYTDIIWLMRYPKKHDSLGLSQKRWKGAIDMIRSKGQNPKTKVEIQTFLTRFP